MAVEFKADDTPVTAIDRAAEELIRERLTAERPADTIVGEEFGVTTGTEWIKAPRRWVIDPIDGTKNFVRGVPVWATLIGLIVDDVAVMGVVERTRARPTLVRRTGLGRVDRDDASGLPHVAAPHLRLGHVGSRRCLPLGQFTHRLGEQGPARLRGRPHARHGQDQGLR